MNIRSITPQDEAVFFSMIQDFYGSDAVDHPVPLHHAKRTFDALMSGSPYLSCLLAEWEGTVCGFALLALTWSNESGGLVVWIEELFVSDRVRGQGVGKKLMAAVHEAYPDATRFRLELTRGNTGAARLYTTLGYKTLAYDQMILDFPPEEPGKA